MEKLVEMSRGLLRRKIPQLQLALEGPVSDHHRFLLQRLMEHLELVESQMTRLEQEIAERLDMKQFPDDELGGPMPGQLGERRQKEKRANSQRQRLVKAAPVPIGLGRVDQAEQLSFCVVPPLGCPSRREACRDRRGPCAAGDHLSHSQPARGVPRPRSELLRPTASGTAQTQNWSNGWRGSASRLASTRLRMHFRRNRHPFAGSLG